MSRIPPVSYETIDWKGKVMVPVDNGTKITLLPLNIARREFRRGNVTLVAAEEWHKLKAEKSSLLDGAYK